ncbi:MAG: DnaJ domain-containing protein, partial [Myxococcus sp.]|nr:DnaJ domain-containing protein [Myxococcus sp.]
ATLRTGVPGASNSVMMRLFGDLPTLEDELHRDVEAQALASLESSLPPVATDDEELQRLEDDVRAEAARRRAAREAQGSTGSGVFSVPAAPPVAEPADDAGLDGAAASAEETSFADVTTPPEGASDPTAPQAAPTSLAPPDGATAREVLARAEAIVFEGRAVSQAQRQAADVVHRKSQAELEALKRRAEHAESLVRREREARAALEDQLEQLREESRSYTEQLEADRVETQQRFASELEAAHGEARLQLAAKDDELGRRIAALEQALIEKNAALAEREVRLAALEDRAQQAELSLEAANATAVERAAERESLLSSLTHEQDAARSAEERAARLEAEQLGLGKDLEVVREQLALAAARVKELSTQLDDERLAKMELDERFDEVSAQLTGAVATAAEATDEAEVAIKLAGEVEAALAVTKTELQGATAALETARAALEAERTKAAERAHDLEALREALETQRARADEAEALAQLSTERLKALEHRQVMNLALPGRRALGLPRTGTVSLEQLAHLVSTLAAAQADVRLELGVRGGTRTLWFKKGALHGAESSFDHESLIDRARRDGLIDARQEADLRLLRTATGLEQVDAMKARGLLREIETVPLLQRATEAVALEAFSEDTTQYRLSDEPPGAAVLLVAVPRATLPLLAEALRRAVPADALLETLGGAQAVCVATDHDVDLRAMGFNDKERKMLSWVDGEASVEDLTLAAGLKQEHAFRALVVARLLGVIEVKPPEKPAPAPSGDLDVRRLEAKYDEVQDADYFSILGLARSASGDDVQRAFRRLSEEFDPIKYTGHPDASLQQRAQVVSTLIEEAARALEDERRRAEYARHLLD